MIASLKGHKFAALYLLLIALITVGIYTHLWQQTPRYDLKEIDIYYSYVDGQRILNGENPYARILSSDMMKNKKYTTYFPIFFALSYLSQAAGLRDYLDWLTFWRYVFLTFDIATAWVIFYTVYQHKEKLFAVFASLFWLMSRWPLHVVEVSNMDFIPIFCLLISLLLFDKTRYSAIRSLPRTESTTDSNRVRSTFLPPIESLLFLSISLAFKHLAIFLVPLYLIWIWRSDQQARVQRTAIAAMIIVSVPILSALPFIYWNAEAFVRSMLFSLTRYPSSHFEVLPIDQIIGILGAPARIPMFCLMILVYLSAMRKTVGRYVSVLLTMAVFIDFSPVLYIQYFAWLTPFIPLAVCDLLMRPAPTSAHQPSPSDSRGE